MPQPLPPRAGPAPHRWRDAGLVLLAGAVLYAGWAVWRGQDANWDLQNYHDYTAYALLHGRHLRDVGPGGFQGYFNPVIYLLPYGLRVALPPLPAAVALATVQAGAVLMAWVLSGVLSGALSAQGRAVRAWATLAGATGAMTLSEVGTSFADLVLAIPVLGAAVLLLRAEGRHIRLLVGAGLLVGAATGLKLTNAVFAAGFGVAMLLPWPWRPVAAALGYGGGAVAGLLLTGGAWAAMLAIKLGNPVFPAMNTWFRSPSAALSDYADVHFLPRGVWDALTYPFQVAAGLSPTAETPFADPRMAVALVLSAIWLLRGRDRAVVRCLVAVWASVAMWLGVFAVQRYVVALEVMCGVLAVHLAVDLAAGLAAALASRRRALVAGTAAVLLLAATRPADWWRRPWSAAYVPRPPPALAEPAAVLMASQPLGFWVPALPEASRVFLMVPWGLASGGLLGQRMSAGLRSPPGGRMWVMAYDVPLEPGARQGLANWGLAPAAPCHRAPSLWWVDTVFCRAAPATDGVAALAVDEPVSFAAPGSGWVYEEAGWLNAAPEGVSNNKPARLLFRPPANAGPLALDLAVVAHTVVPATVDGQPAAEWPADTALRTRTLCVPGTGAAVRVGFEGRLMAQGMRLRQPATGEC